MPTSPKAKFSVVDEDSGPNIANYVNSPNRLRRRPSLEQLHNRIIGGKITPVSELSVNNLDTTEKAEVSFKKLTYVLYKDHFVYHLFIVQSNKYFLFVQ